MKPGVSHSVHTVGESICVGGHFHALETMDAALESGIEEALYGQTITNTEHLESDALLFRLLDYFKRDSRFVEDKGERWPGSGRLRLKSSNLTRYIGPCSAD